MKVGRGAQRAINSWASTSRSPAFLLPKLDSAAPYFRKLPAIQWYSPEPVRLSTASPKFRRCSFARASRQSATTEKSAAEHHQHWHRAFRVRRSNERHLNVYLDGRTGGIVHMPDQFLRGNRHGADYAVRRLGQDCPGHLRNIF